MIFVEPYASKGACTVSKGYNFIPINRLYRERLLFLGQGVDSEISNQLIGLMVYLSIEDDTKDLYLFINSPGGWVIPGVAIYDTMQYIAPDVSTICIGMAASMGAFLLAGGAKGKRYALPNAEIMIHQPLGGARGQATDIQIQAEQILKIKEKMNRMLSENTGKDFAQVCLDTERDNYMSAQEAKEYGLVDEVVKKPQ